MPTEKQNEIAEYLRGTCKSSGDAAEEFNVDEDEVLEAVVEAEVDLCATCGWWCEMSEMETVDDELVCDQCREETNED